MTKLERVAFNLALDALQFKNVLNVCGRFSTIDVKKVAVAVEAIQKILAQSEERKHG